MDTGMHSLPARAASALASRLRGRLVLPADPGYAIARRVWNAGIDRHPCAIARCADAEDVARAVRIATEHGVPITVRGGGHNVAGRAVADGALLLDLSLLRAVTVNAAARVARVEGGATWHDVDTTTAPHRLATTGGLVSGTGVGGFTLGGGAGWLMRMHGLASDNLLSASVVLADGRIIRASGDEHPDLFWALRGGAGGLGVATSFEFSLHPVADVLAGVVIRPASEAAPALRQFIDFCDRAPDEFCGMTVLARAPSLPFLAAAWHGQPVVVMALCWCGDPAEGERALAPLRGFGAPLADHVGPMPYVQWQHLQDPGAPPGRYQYWKTASFGAMDARVIEHLAAALHDLPSPQTEIHVQHMGGAVARMGADATAFAQRDVQFFVNLIGVTPWAEGLGPLRDRVRALHAVLAADALPALLPNFSNLEDGEVTTGPGAAHAARILDVRHRHDPAGVFATPGT